MKQPLYAMSYFYERPEQSLASHPSKPEAQVSTVQEEEEEIAIASKIANQVSKTIPTQL